MSRADIGDLLLMAQCELSTNPTITAYVMVGDREVRYRRGYDSLIGLIDHMISEALAALCDIIGIDRRFLDEVGALCAPLSASSGAE